VPIDGVDARLHTAGSASPAHKLPPYLGVYAGLSALCALLVAFHPLNFLSDDSLFYLVIADRISAGQGSTFNGLFPTNGYHPLWEACAAVLALIPHSKPSLLVYGVVVQWLAGTATLWILLNSLRTIFGRSGLAAFVAVMLALFVPFGNLFWTEAPLTMLFLAIILTMMLSEIPLRYGVLGVLLGLLFLSRLDNVFLIGCFVIGLWLRDRDWRLGLSCVICAAIGGAYIASNLVNFGHMMPISGAIKSAAYRHTYFAGALGVNGLISLAGAGGLGVVNLLRRSRPRSYRIAMIALSAGVVLQSLYVVALTYGDTTWVWYYVPGYLCLALLAAEGTDWLQSVGAGSSGKALLALSVLVSLGVASLKFFVNSSLHDPTASGGHWRDTWMETIARTLPHDGSILVVFDQPGLFAYGTSHPVFSLDGLTGNYALEALLERQGMYSQIAQYPTAYFVAPTVAPGEKLRATATNQTGDADGQIVHFATALRAADAGCIRIAASALVTTLSAPRVLNGGELGVWRLNAQTMAPATCTDSVPVRSGAYFTRSR
jgi:hypothetical protein